MNINETNLTLSSECIEAIERALTAEALRIKKEIGSLLTLKGATDLCQQFIEIQTVRDSLLESEFYGLVDQFPCGESRTVEVKSRDDGKLKSPMSDEILLDILFPKYNELTRLTFNGQTSLTVTEVGLYTVKISLGGFEMERKIWLVPTTSEK